MHGAQTAFPLPSPETEDAKAYIREQLQKASRKKVQWEGEEQRLERILAGLKGCNAFLAGHQWESTFLPTGADEMEGAYQ
jgi:hypothetical protein